jgi:RNA 3'-terminal phosphate cyclase-like protein
MSSTHHYIKLDGSSHFRQRLVLSTLSGKPLQIDAIRADDQSPGLKDYEASLLRLIEKVTNGCSITINETGTRLRYRPGFVHGGGDLSHDCGTSRSIGYFLEPLCLIAIFGKYPLTIKLTGITNDDIDCGVDMWRTVTLPLLRNIVGGGEGVVGAFELKIHKRGVPPLGGGEVVLSVPITKKKIPPISMLEEGLVKRVRGIAYGCKVSPSITNRLVDGARGVLNALIPDVYVFTDHMSGGKGGLSPGYGLLLVGETTSGRMVAAEVASGVGGENTVQQRVPEDVGRQAACMLLEEVSKGGVVDTSHQGLLLLLCAVGPEEINEARLGPLTPYAVKTLRHIKEFLGVQFSVRPENTTGTIFLSCIGAGIANSNKRIT